LRKYAVYVNFVIFQGSVIMMICLIMLMEYKDRGIIMMWPNLKSTGKFTNYLRLSPGPIELVRK